MENPQSHYETVRPLILHPYLSDSVLYVHVFVLCLFTGSPQLTFPLLCPTVPLVLSSKYTCASTHVLFTSSTYECIDEIIFYNPGAERIFFFA